MFFFLHTFLEFEHNFFVVHLTGLTFFLVSPFQPQEFWDAYSCSEKVWILVKRLFDTHPKKNHKIGIWSEKELWKVSRMDLVFITLWRIWSWNGTEIDQTRNFHLTGILDRTGNNPGCLGSGMIRKGSRIIEFLELPSTPFRGQ